MPVDDRHLSICSSRCFRYSIYDDARARGWAARPRDETRLSRNAPAAASSQSKVLRYHSSSLSYPITFVVFSA